MSAFKKARTLPEVAAQTTMVPLRPGDVRYVDIAAGRGATDLEQLRIHLTDADASQNRFAAVAFTGHRGSGKSTELLRLEHDLRHRFTCLHLYVDDNLLGDCDYTDLLLWLVDDLVRKFTNEELPLDEKLVDDVLGWFAEKTLDSVRTVKKEIRAEATAEAKAKAGLPWLSVMLLARVKSSFLGSSEQRTLIRRKLQSYSSDLIRKVNLLLDNAQTALERGGKRPDLLIVQDNLDRLQTDAARRLFHENGDLLKSLHAHVIYTVPIPMVLSPYNIGNVFEQTFTMPMVRICDPDGQEFKAGVDALVELLAARLDIDVVFEGADVPRFLAKMSGGSVRDFIRLVSYAQLVARAVKKDRMDRDSAAHAVKKLRLDFERLLIPGQVYFPLLAQIHRHKQLTLPKDTEPDVKKVQTDREFFSQLIFNGSVLEYNGERNWYDVHPVVQEIEAFRNALAQTDVPKAVD